MYSLYITSLTFNNSTFCPQVYLCILCRSENNRAIILFTALKYPTFCLISLTFILILENKYISEFSQKSTQLSVYADQTTFFTNVVVQRKWARNLPLFQCVNSQVHTVLHMQCIRVFVFMRKNSCHILKLRAHLHLMPS